jgi:hypothetical protein
MLKPAAITGLAVAGLIAVGGTSYGATVLASHQTASTRPAATAPAHTTAPAPAKTIVVTPPPAKVIINNPAPAQAPAPPAQAPAAPLPAALLHNVGNQVWASSATSDAFAWNVVSAWDGNPGVKYVSSPVTGKTYAMTYQISGPYVIASGGNGAYVQWDN